MSRLRSVLSLLLISAAIATPSQSQARSGFFRTIFGTSALVTAILTDNKSEQTIASLIALACYTSIALDLAEDENDQKSSPTTYKIVARLLVVAAVTAFVCSR